MKKRKRREIERAIVKKLVKRKLIRTVRFRDFLDGSFDLEEEVVVVVEGRSE